MISCEKFLFQVLESQRRSHPLLCKRNTGLLVLVARSPSLSSILVLQARQELRQAQQQLEQLITEHGSNEAIWQEEHERCKNLEEKLNALRTQHAQSTSCQHQLETDIQNLQSELDKHKTASDHAPCKAQMSKLKQQLALTQCELGDAMEELSVIDKARPWFSTSKGRLLNLSLAVCSSCRVF